MLSKFLYFFVQLLILALPQYSFSQGQANIWHFGAFCGIDFNSGTPVSISGPINTIEGCASMCDSNGVLLFSTNGVTVYNSTGAIMINGLLGSQISTQSALIIPWPGSLSKYYIFTTAASGGVQGLNYSVVDMTLNSGLGGVTTLNSLLLTPVCEKITAVYDANDTAIWIISHLWGSNEFYSFKITPFGFNSPVISAIGVVANSSNLYDGYLKSSPDGNKLAACYLGNNGSDFLEVYDFNNSTGVVSNAVVIPPPHENSYGACFSPDNSKLYITSTTAINAIIQLDLTNINYATNPFIVYNGGNIGFGGIQLAPDGKIYIAEDGTSSLSVINNPNSNSAACNFALNSLTLVGTSHFGLPDFFEPLFINHCSVNIGSDTGLCTSVTLLLNGGSDSLATYIWNDGTTNQTLLVDTSGIYTLTKTTATGCIAKDSIDIKYYQDYDISLGADIVACQYQLILLDPGAGYITYHWSNSTPNQTLSPTTSGNYFVQVSDSNGCFYSDTVNVNFIPPANPLLNNWSICLNDSFLLNAGGGYSYYDWNTGSFDSSIMIYSPGTYSVIVKDSIGCLTTDSIVISISSPSINIGNDTLICGQFNYNLNAGNGFATYHWQNNTSNQNLVITSAGNYSVTITDIFGCTTSDTINTQNSNPQVSIGNDTVICNNTYAIITATNGFDLYLWNNGSINDTLITSMAGIYSVIVTDEKGCKDSDSKIITVDSPFLFIGNDSSSCNGSGIIFDAGNLFANYLWSDNSSTSTFSTTGAGIYSVTVTDFIGCKASDTVIVSYSDCMEIYVPSGFSPNGDGHNDYFHILNAADFIFQELEIYNRWGQLIFKTQNPTDFWNGEFNGSDCEVGVYIYIVSGSNFVDHYIFKKGNITLVR